MTMKEVASDPHFLKIIKQDISSELMPVPCPKALLVFVMF